MSLNSDSNTNYHDFNSLSRLRVDARKDSPEALKEVAKQFEAVFVQMMIKSMREASVPLQGELFNGDQTKAYTDMYDKQLGLELSKSNGIGLADVIMRQLSRPESVVSAEDLPSQQTLSTQNISPATSNRQNVSFVINRTEPISTVDFVDKVEISTVNDQFDVQVENIQQSPHWSNPEEFIRDSWPHAQQAGRELGVDPRVILAQSALETGWGKKVHFTDQGENSYSLFGIKAGSNWQGKTVSFNTLEFRSGSMNRETASFRAYDSLSESYQDYVNFLQANPRYNNVLNADSSRDYSVQLQKAGYATDPNYSNKIERIRQGDLMNRVVSELKVSTTEPLT